MERQEIKQVATFRIEPDFWNQFKSICRDKGVKHTAMVRDFILAEIEKAA